MGVIRAAHGVGVGTAAVAARAVCAAGLSAGAVGTVGALRRVLIIGCRQRTGGARGLRNKAHRNREVEEDGGDDAKRGHRGRWGRRLLTGMELVTSCHVVTGMFRRREWVVSAPPRCYSKER